jgi:Flp pilus assembly protein TadD
MTGLDRSTISSVSVATVAVLLLAAYANHFHNAFHFDDDHAIVSNPYVRSLTFVPQYFVDATTFSVLPLNQMYRPVTQTTFAVDYALHGYDVRVFHADSFVWFLLLLFAAAMLVRALTGSGAQALAVAAIFGLHPAVADTVNYLVQRGEILAALGVVSGLALFVASPRLRASGAYLLPVVLGLMAKQTAAAFPLLLVTYVWMYEERIWTRDTIVATLVVAIAAAWVVARTPATTAYASLAPVRYVLTQPFMAVRYAATFFAPVSLTADPDWPLVDSARDPAVAVGLAFIALTMASAWRLRRSAQTRPIAFGLAWFLLAQAPTALVPLTEVGNDWRMFLPFIGLAIAVVATVASVAQAFRPAASAALKGCATAVLVVLLAEAAGVHARNEVWRTDESLWRDATAKSPGNPRAWMNYGVALMARGDYAAAVDACERALPLAPDYTLLHVNLGVAYGAVGRRADAEREFVKAQRLAPDDWRTHLYFGQWLMREGRAGEARRELDRARALNRVAMPNQQM